MCGRIKQLCIIGKGVFNFYSFQTILEILCCMCHIKVWKSLHFLILLTQPIFLQTKWITIMINSLLGIEYPISCGYQDEMNDMDFVIKNPFKNLLRTAVVTTCMYVRSCQILFALLYTYTNTFCVRFTFILTLSPHVKTSRVQLPNTILKNCHVCNTRSGS